MNRRGFALAVVVLATVMDLVDGTVVNIVLPSIQRELGTSHAAAGWIASGYTWLWGRCSPSAAASAISTVRGGCSS